MKILLDVSSVSLPLSGIGRYALELARHLPEQEFVECVRYLRDGQVQDNLDLPEVATTGKSGSVRQLVKTLVPYGMVLAPYRRMKAKNLARSLEGYQDHVFHSPNFAIPPVSGRAVVTLHDLSVFHFPQFHPRDRVNYLQDQVHFSVERADALVTDSEFVRSELLELFKVDPAKVHVIPLGVDTAFRPRAREDLVVPLARYGLEPGSYILSVGTIEPRKNHTALLHAYRGMDEGLRKRNKLVIAGAYGWKGTDAMKEIRQLASLGELVYLDYVPEDQLPLIYAGASAFCYFSFYEGFGLPVLESCASGVPVVCSDIPALRELTAGCALQVSPHDVPGMTRGMEKVLTDESWRFRMSEAGRAHSEHYRWNNTARALADVFRGLSGPGQ
jgi:alpha-1,3-rhamnosyl/mannosyltransferase